MKIINRTIKISEGTEKIEFDLADLPEGEYEVQLTITDVDNKPRKADFSSWSSGITIPPGLTFSREEMYGDDGR